MEVQDKTVVDDIREYKNELVKVANIVDRDLGIICRLTKLCDFIADKINKYDTKGYFKRGSNDSRKKV
jgi:Ni,Fe-hydrogenase III large subunit